MTRIVYRNVSDLPETLPVFPLEGAILFPRWHLPLNIFEPRYLAMIDDALSGSRLIGMIQPLDQSRTPKLADIGCAGRIVSYSETDDGRYLITLHGICRYRIDNEVKAETPYRQIEADWSAYSADIMQPAATSLPPRQDIINAMRRYSEAKSIQTDWPAMEDADLETLINALSAGCPFSVMEKQALIEADTLQARALTLIKLLQLDTPGSSPTLQ